MIVSDLVRVALDLLKMDRKGFEKGYKMGKAIKNPLGSSIKSRTKDLVLQYPLLLSDTISLDTATLLSRSLEHEYVNLVSILLNSSNIQKADGTKEISATEFITQYHKNINRSYFENVTPTDIEKSHKSLLESIDSKLNTDILNNFTIPRYLSEAKNSNAGGNRNGQGVPQSSYVKANIDKYDIKKANDLTPTTVSATINWLVDQQVVTQNITFGVKTVIHPVSSDDVVYYLSDTVKDSNKFFQLIRWTSGEIKLFKDLLLAVDMNKKMAKQNTSKDNYWWRKLSTMGKEAEVRKILGQADLLKGKKGSPIPTATLCISKQDVDNIKNIHGLDLISNTGAVYKIMKKLFLLSFVIVDETTQIAYIFNDNTRDFNHFSFDSLKNFAKEKDTDLTGSKSMFR